MIAISLMVAVVLAIIDQVIKYFVVLNLKPVGMIEVIKNLFSLSYLENTGVAFGLLKNMSWIYIPVTLLGCAALIFVLFKYKDEITCWSRMALVLLLGGGIGNLIDRIRIGYVIDYLRVEFFPYIFNFADCCVVIGSILLVISVFLLDRSEFSVEEGASTPPPSGNPPPTQRLEVGVLPSAHADKEKISKNQEHELE